MGDALTFPTPWAVRPLSACLQLFQVDDARGHPIATLLPRAVADQVAAAPAAAALLDLVRAEVARLAELAAQGLGPDEADPLPQLHRDLVVLLQRLGGVS